MRPLIAILAVSIVLTGIPLTALAQDEASYAQREAQSPGLEEWQGGFHWIVIGALVILGVVLLIVLIVHAVDHDHPEPRPMLP